MCHELTTECRNTVCPKSMFIFEYIIVNTLREYNSNNNNNNNVFKVLIYLFVMYLPAHPVIRTACRRILEQLVERMWKKEAGVLSRYLPRRTEKVSENLSEGSWCAGRGLNRVYPEQKSELLQLLHSCLIYYHHRYRYHTEPIETKLYSNIYPTRYNVTQFIISGNCSTCFGWYPHPSSGAQTTASTS